VHTTPGTSGFTTAELESLFGLDDAETYGVDVVLITGSGNVTVVARFLRENLEFTARISIPPVSTPPTVTPPPPPPPVTPQVTPPPPPVTPQITPPPPAPVAPQTVETTPTVQTTTVVTTQQTTTRPPTTTRRPTVVKKVKAKKKIKIKKKVKVKRRGACIINGRVVRPCVRGKG
jgi:hypothetical protein